MWKINITNKEGKTVFERITKSLTLAMKTIEKAVNTYKDPDGMIATISDLSGKVVKKMLIIQVNGKIEFKDIT